MNNSSNSFARLLAPVALIAAGLLIIIVIGSSTGGEDSSTPGKQDRQQSKDSSGDSKDGKASAVQRSAIKRGYYVVEEGDTLVDISAVTGVSVEDIVALNDGLDPQLLVSGQKVFLRAK